MNAGSLHALDIPQPGERWTGRDGGVWAMPQTRTVTLGAIAGRVHYKIAVRRFGGLTWSHRVCSESEWVGWVKKTSARLRYIDKLTYRRPTATVERRKGNQNGIKLET